jgi:ABC-type antimicrobial peptide transport system permease subunit
MALTIAAAGLYGLLAYATVRRRREIAIRIALGAPPSSVERMILLESLVLLAAGFALGVPAAMLVSRFVSSMLFGLSPGDPATVAATLAILAVATIAAAYIPARKAASIDPIVALREE